MSLRCAVQVRISDLSESQAGSVIAALEPDNSGMPEGLGVAARYGEEGDGAGRILTLEFEGVEDGGGKGGVRAVHAMGSLVGTVDEVLEHVQVALKVMDSA
ncbi:MAG: hypothetical protein J4F28_04070 [Nitrosopumilaceae archaeon]|nr:hypothetical protein [Nitrosopumilaceae archaeon]